MAIVALNSQKSAGISEMTRGCGGERGGGDGVGRLATVERGERDGNTRLNKRRKGRGGDCASTRYIQI